MNPALPLVLLYAVAVGYAARIVLIPHHTPRSAATSEPGDGASRSNFRTGARTPLLGPTSQETNCAMRKLVGCFIRVQVAVNAPAASLLHLNPQLLKG